MRTMVTNWIMCKLMLLIMIMSYIAKDSLGTRLPEVSSGTSEWHMNRYFSN